MPAPRTPRAQLQTNVAAASPRAISSASSFGTPTAAAAAAAVAARRSSRRRQAALPTRTTSPPPALPSAAPSPSASSTDASSSMSLNSAAAAAHSDEADKSKAPEPTSFCDDHTKLEVWENLPAWMRENDCIRTGYRVHYTYRACVKSFWRLHNESMNVWTHVIGALLFFVLIVHLCVSPVMQPPSFFPVDFSSAPPLSPTANSSFGASLAAHGAASIDPRDADAPAFLRGALAALRARFAAWTEDPQPNHASADLAPPPTLPWSTRVGRVAMECVYESARVALLAAGALIEPCARWIASAAPAVRWPVFCFLACAVAAMLMSATCHLFCNHSPRANCVLTRLDYSGIALLIVGSNVPCAFYGFFCTPGYAALYLLIQCASSLAALAACMSDTIMSWRYRRVRAAVFVLNGLVAAGPITHMALMADSPPVIHHLIAMGATYIGGAVLFALRAPECFAPGRFDYFFASHQVFHVCVIVAAGFHYQAVANLYAWRQATACPAGALTLF